MRLHWRLPYGMWMCEDRRMVLFNRWYWPIWQRYPDEDAKPVTYREWVPHIWGENYFDDGNPPWRNKRTLIRCEAVLVSWGLPADACPAYGREEVEAQKYGGPPRLLSEFPNER